jgi:hypothetical protein
MNIYEYEYVEICIDVPLLLSNPKAGSKTEAAAAQESKLWVCRIGIGWFAGLSLDQSCRVSSQYPLNDGKLSRLRV